MEETVAYTITTPDGKDHPDIMIVDGQSAEDILGKAQSLIEENFLEEGYILSSIEIMERLPITFPKVVE